MEIQFEKFNKWKNEFNIFLESIPYGIFQNEDIVAACNGAEYIFKKDEWDSMIEIAKHIHEWKGDANKRNLVQDVINEVELNVLLADSNKSSLKKYLDYVMKENYHLLTKYRYKTNKRNIKGREFDSRLGVINDGYRNIGFRIETKPDPISRLLSSSREYEGLSRLMRIFERHMNRFRFHDQNGIIKYEEFSLNISATSNLTIWFRDDNDKLIRFIDSDIFLAYSTNALILTEEIKNNLTSSNHHTNTILALNPVRREITLNIANISNEEHVLRYLQFIRDETHQALNRMLSDTSYNILISSDKDYQTLSSEKTRYGPRIVNTDFIGELLLKSIKNVPYIQKLLIFIESKIKLFSIELPSETPTPPPIETDTFKTILEPNYVDHSDKFIGILADMKFLTAGLRWNTEKEKGIVKVFWEELRVNDVVKNTVKSAEAGRSFSNELNTPLSDMFAKPVGAFSNIHRDELSKKIKKLISEIKT